VADWPVRRSAITENGDGRWFGLEKVETIRDESLIEGDVRR
jgi:hypothetical protein